MQKLNLPEYSFKLKQQNGKIDVFDRIRKKYVALTPEEWVRQNFICYLIQEKNVPESLIAVEKEIKCNNMCRRTDIVVYSKLAKPVIIVECKAPDVEIKNDTFEQIVRYNMVLQVNYLVVTNGLQHYCCFIDYLDNSYHFLEYIPNYTKL